MHLSGQSGACATLFVNASSSSVQAICYSDRQGSGLEQSEMVGILGLQ